MERASEPWYSGFKETLPVADGGLRLKVGSGCTTLWLRQPGPNPDGGPARARAYAEIQLDGGVSKVDLGVVTLTPNVAADDD